jgi:predicted amidophosphoribosyltransferase
VTACLRSDPTLRTQLNTNILKRIRHTKPQTELSAEERSRNVAHAFVARARVRATIDPEQPIVIIDDVYTTGATMRAARTAMRTAFPHHTIHCLTFAYA